MTLWRWNFGCKRLCSQWVLLIHSFTNWAMLQKNEFIKMDWQIFEKYCLLHDYCRECIPLQLCQYLAAMFSMPPHICVYISNISYAIVAQIFKIMIAQGIRNKKLVPFFFLFWFEHNLFYFKWHCNQLQFMTFGALI